MFEQPPYRPPSEARSLLIRATRNCPWNRCAFCNMYKGERFEIRPVDEVKRDIWAARDLYDRFMALVQQQGHAGRESELAPAYGLPWIRGDGKITVFLADSNSLVMRTAQLAEIVRCLYEAFPHLQRVTSYARAHTILHKTPAELRTLADAGLTRVHLGLESGDDEVLAMIQKGATAEQMVQGGLRAKNAGLSVSEYVILGMGGMDRWEQHAVNTARVLNQIDPDFIRLRTVMVQAGTPLCEMERRGEFRVPTAEEILREERRLVAELDVQSSFVSDHVSNYLAIDGRLPADKPLMFQALDAALEVLRTSPDAAKDFLTPEDLRRP